jgi:hypothetical protein
LLREGGGANQTKRAILGFASIALIHAVIESGARGLANIEKILALLIFRSSKMVDC